jgi:hypothetical protein
MDSHLHASTPHRTTRRAQASHPVFDSHDALQSIFLEKNPTPIFLRRPSPREISDAIHLFVFLRHGHVGAGTSARRSLRLGPTPPPPLVLHTMGGPTSIIKDGISLSARGEGAAGSGEVRSDAAKGGVDLALGLSRRTRRQLAQRRSDHTSTTTATSTRRLEAEHRGCCPPANSPMTLSCCSKVRFSLPCLLD